jgi:hypothetical protein
MRFQIACGNQPRTPERFETLDAIEEPIERVSNGRLYRTEAVMTLAMMLKGLRHHVIRHPNQLASISAAVGKQPDMAIAPIDHSERRADHRILFKGPNLLRDSFGSTPALCLGVLPNANSESDRSPSEACALEHDIPEFRICHNIEFPR